MVNKVILIGNLGKDPEMSYTPSGVAVTKVSLATTKKWTSGSGEKREQTEWHNLVFWRKSAEIANEYLRKGSRIYVDGEITYRTWEGNDGQKRYATDIVVNNSGGPPTGNFRQWDREIWMAALNNNMLGAIFMIKDTVDGMIERKFGRIVNITSSAVKAPISILGLSNSARSGLTGFVAGVAREVAKHNVTINNLLPGDFATERHESNTRAMAKVQNRTYEEMMAIRPILEMVRCVE